RAIELMRARSTNGIVRQAAATGGNALFWRAERPRWGVYLMIIAARFLLFGPFLALLAIMLSAAGAMAQPRELSVAVSSARVVEFPRPARTVFIADPAIADIQVAAPTTVIVFGRKPGQTTLIAIGEDDKQLASIQVSVG